MFIKKSKNIDEINNELYWSTMKWSIVLPVVLYFIFSLMKYSAQPFPIGICTLFDCSLLCSSPSKWIFISLLLLFAYLYIAEKAMVMSLFFLSLFSVIIFSLQESNGNPAENGIVSLLFIVQFFSYLLDWINPKRYLENDRIQFSLQIIASVYVLSAISKLSSSGFHWFTDDAPYFILEIQRVYQAKYAATGLALFRETGDTVTIFFIHHILLLKLMLFGALAIELFAFFMLINRTWTIFYGLLLFSLHIGIYLIMDITFPTIMMPMIAVTINPAYWVIVGFNKSEIFK